jgi:hypothetical protein
VIVAERLEPGKHPIDLRLICHDGRQRLLARPSVQLLDPGVHLWRHPSLSKLMNASSGAISQRKIDPIVLFFSLTSKDRYGWRRGLMIVWFGLRR